MPTGVAEFDRALGGGLIAGQVVLIGGDPGIGKSTLLLQALAWMSAARKVIYVSGEESAEQVALRAQRLQVDTAAVALAAEIQLERIAATLEAEKPEVAVIDSIQTLYSEALAVGPGLGGAGARVRGAADAARQDARHRTDLRRPRDQGGCARGAARARAHRRYRALLRGRSAFELSSHPRGQEPVWSGERARRLRDDRARPARREQPVGAVPFAAPRAGAGVLHPGHERGHPAAARRGAGARRWRARHGAPTSRPGVGPEPARDAARGAASARRSRRSTTRTCS